MHKLKDLRLRKMLVLWISLIAANFYKLNSQQLESYPGKGLTNLNITSFNLFEITENATSHSTTTVRNINQLLLPFNSRDCFVHITSFQTQLFYLPKFPCILRHIYPTSWYTSKNSSITKTEGRLMY